MSHSISETNSFSPVKDFNLLKNQLCTLSTWKTIFSAWFINRTVISLMGYDDSWLYSVFWNLTSIVDKTETLSPASNTRSLKFSELLGIMRSSYIIAYYIYDTLVFTFQSDVLGSWIMLLDIMSLKIRLHIMVSCFFYLLLWYTVDDRSVININDNLLISTIVFL